ncbi:hypothetical protein H4R27_001566 [Coemansia aciculifera]|nr:hypothetical protein H4R27_001566 [Coemansia aciculifera]
MTNTTTPPNTRSNNVANNQPLATQQPTTTEKIKDSVKSAVNKAQNVLTGSNTKTMTPPSNNDATHVIGDNRRHHEKADIVGNVDGRHHDKTNMGAAYDVSKNKAENKAAGNVVGVHEANEPLRRDGVVNKTAGAAGNVVGKVEGTTERVIGLHHHDGRDKHGLSNDVGNTDKHGAKYTGHENRIGQQTGAVPQQTNLVPPPPQQQMGNKVTGNNAFDNTERLGNVSGNNAFDNTRRGNANVDLDLSYAGPVNPGLPDITNRDARQGAVPPNKVSATNRADEANRF